MSSLVWERLGVLPKELEIVAGERDVWVSGPVAAATQLWISGRRGIWYLDLGVQGCSPGCSLGHKRSCDCVKIQLYILQTLN